MTYKDMAGKKYNKLTVIEEVGRSKTGELLWRCKCDCGNEKILPSRRIRDGCTKSCGCVWKANLAKGGYIHGLYNHPLHHTWIDMKGRCTCKTNYSYRYYGGRGITLCDEWIDDCKAFIDWAESHGWKPGLTIDRIDVNGPYAPENCRWATRADQANNMRSNHLITYNGKTQNLSQWAREYGIPRSRLSARLHSGWDLERALLEPVHKR